MASMRFEYKLSAGSTWSTACTDITPPSPFSCSWDTTTVADGTYDLRSIAIDATGNPGPPATVTGRVVDNTGPALTVSSPGMFRGSATINATATDATGVSAAGVTIQYSLAGANSWATACSDASSPYSCSWNSAGRAGRRLRPPGDRHGHARQPVLFGPRQRLRQQHGPDGLRRPGHQRQRQRQARCGRHGDLHLQRGDHAVVDPRRLDGRRPRGDPVRVNNTGTADSMEFYDAANTTPLGLLASGTTLAINIDHVTAATLFNATISRSGRRSPSRSAR